MLNEDLIKSLKNSIITLNENEAMQATDQIICSGIDPRIVIEQGITEAAKIIGEKFEKMEYFLGELLIAEEMITQALDKILLNVSEDTILENKGNIVIATVFGDIHDIGKNLLSQLLKLNGFNVHDLGNNVPSMQVVNKAIETNADIIALSALMSTTMPAQKEVINIMEAIGIRDNIKVIIGGGSTSPEWKENIKADGWAETAWDGVKLAMKIIGEDL